MVILVELSQLTPPVGMNLCIILSTSTGEYLNRHAAFFVNCCNGALFLDE